MSGKAEITIHLYRSLYSEEKMKLKSIESSISTILLNNGINGRGIWEGETGNDGVRYIRFYLINEENSKERFELREDELAEFSADDLISLLEKRLK